MIQDDTGLLRLALYDQKQSREMMRRERNARPMGAKDCPESLMRFGARILFGTAGLATLFAAGYELFQVTATVLRF